MPKQTAPPKFELPVPAAPIAETRRQGEEETRSEENAPAAGTPPDSLSPCLPVSLSPPDASRPVAVLELPIAPADDQKGYIARHVDLQLDTNQAATLRRLVRGMDAAHVRLKNGRVVQNASDVIRFILEQAGPPAD